MALRYKDGRQSAPYGTLEAHIHEKAFSVSMALTLFAFRFQMYTTMHDFQLTVDWLSRSAVVNALATA